MIRNIKALGLALVAVLAMSAVIASAAQATPTLSLGEATGDITGEQLETNKFTVDGSAVECKIAHYTGMATSGSTWVTAHPTYEECSAFGFLNATITTTGCNYEAMATGTEGEKMNFAGELKVVCETGKEIIISSGGVCEAKVGNQTITEGLTWTNTTISPMDVDLDVVNSPVKVNKTKDGFGCPFSGTGATTGTYNGGTTFRAYKTEQPHTAANQIDLTVAP